MRRRYDEGIALQFKALDVHSMADWEVQNSSLAVSQEMVSSLCLHVLDAKSACGILKTDSIGCMLKVSEASPEEGSR